MIDRTHDLPITRQARALNISRGSVYYLPRPVPEADLAIMRHLDRLHLEFPFAGSRMLRGLLAAEGCKIGRRHVKTLMKRMGIEALYRRPRTTKPEPGHKIYPYLLCGSWRSHGRTRCGRWVRTFDTIEELRAALVEFATRYNETWLVARHGYRTPAKVRADQCRIDQNATADLKLAA